MAPVKNFFMGPEGNPVSPVDAANNNLINPDAYMNNAYGIMYRDQAEGGLDMLRQQALGNAPSVAKMETDRMQNQLRQGAQSMAQSGAYNPANQRSAQMAVAQGTGEVAGRGAEAAAKERLAAQGMYNQAAQGMFGMDANLRNADRNALMQLNHDRSNLHTSQYGTSSQAQTASAAAGGQMFGAGLGALAAGLMPSSEKLKPSDERAKRDISSGDDPIEQLLDELSPKEYRYIEGVDDGGAQKHVGVMAQDVERTPSGAGMVQEDAQGMKSLDVGDIAQASLAASANIHKRLKALEAKGGGQGDDDIIEQILNGRR